MTPAGCKLVRSWTGAKAYHHQPGTLREWHWRGLACAYAAGDEGLDDLTIGYATTRPLED